MLQERLPADVCSRVSRSTIVFVVMFENFTAIDRWTKKQVHCVYQAMIVVLAGVILYAFLQARRAPRDQATTHNPATEA